MVRRYAGERAMTVANMSGIILVTCDDKSSKNIIKESKLKLGLVGVLSAYIVDKKASTPDAPNVVINVDAEDKEDIPKAANILLNMDGVQKVRYQIV
jgi:hypothetical protein